ncbi:MAG: DUF5615 family PIN-like protein [Pirellulales bacterium]|nr:DUF5615 family PIN-like protein [Pirellulales bacterium]
MKIVLDENLPHRLRHEIVGHEVVTIAYLGWSGVENGELLRRAAAAGFDALVTNDRGLEFEQNLLALPLSVIVVLAPTNTMDALRPLLPHLHDALVRLAPRSFVRIP